MKNAEKLLELAKVGRLVVMEEMRISGDKQLRRVASVDEDGRIVFDLFDDEDPEKPTGKVSALPVNCFTLKKCVVDCPQPHVAVVYGSDGRAHCSYTFDIDDTF